MDRSANHIEKDERSSSGQPDHSTQRPKDDPYGAPAST
jgi:hypothetical protein